MHYARFSKYHPDNMAKVPDLSLPEPVKGPEPLCKATAVDAAKGLWGHALQAEIPYGPLDSSLKIRTNTITAKIGQQWNVQFEQNGSRMKSGVYAGSHKQLTSQERVELAGGKSPFL